jgi:hypothetical protein
MTQHAVFLSYNSVDHLAVEEIAKRLRAADIELWLDTWQVAAGDPVQRALEQALTETRASVVFIGPSGIGPCRPSSPASAGSSSSAAWTKRHRSGP